MKKALKITGILALLVVVGISLAVWWVFHNLDSIAKTQIEQAGHPRPRRLHHRRLRRRPRLDGNLAISGLDIAKPVGVQGPSTSSP